MFKIAATFLTLCTAGFCAAQPAVHAGPKHFRLTFVLTYPQGHQPSQSFVLDVPVTQERSGTSGLNVTAGLTGQTEGSIQESLQCTDVKESATGLAGKVTFSMDTLMEPAPNSTEPRHRQLTFDRKVDLVLGKPTRITKEMRKIPLRKGDEALPNTLPLPPQITVTAIQM
jgi:hypothetical protein